MTIKVKLFANFSEAAGKDQEMVEGVADLSSLLEELARRFGGKMDKLLYSSGERKLRRAVGIFVNGLMINTSTELDTPLKDGDVVAIFPPVAGG